MTDETTTTAADSMVRGLVEAFSEAGDRAVPLASTDAEVSIRTQLTENTGRHLLDSGGAYGRHWEENQDNPPWEQSAWEVGDGYVAHNVYDYLLRRASRDEACVALETALYAFAYSDDRKRDSWLQCMEEFAEAATSGELHPPELRALGVPEEAITSLPGIYSEKPLFTFNTYNGEFHTLSQVIQGVAFGGPYAEYDMVQVHGGADVRGGYTAPRVYSTSDGLLPGELQFRCETCGWSEAESCLYGDYSLLYQRSIDPFELEEKGWLPEDEDDQHPALAAAYDADSTDGAVFHRCRDEPGHFGHVTFM